MHLSKNRAGIHSQYLDAKYTQYGWSIEGDYSDYTTVIKSIKMLEFLVNVYSNSVGSLIPLKRIDSTFLLCLKIWSIHDGVGTDVIICNEERNFIFTLIVSLTNGSDLDFIRFPLSNLIPGDSFEILKKHFISIEMLL